MNIENNFQRKKIEIPSKHEYRIQLSKDVEISIKILRGTAEIFGEELVINQSYQHKGPKSFSLYSFNSAEIEIFQNTSNELGYLFGGEFEEDHVNCYANINFFLDFMRLESNDKLEIGPKILVCGSGSSGKLTLCKTLVNYAVKNMWKPIFCDLDVVGNSIGMPGTIGCCKLEDFFPNDFSEIQSKLIFFHGYRSYAQTKLYEEQVKTLANNVNNKLESELKRIRESNHDEEYLNLFVKGNKNLFSSGAIIKAPAFSPSADFSIYKTIIDNFGIQMVIVLDNDGLYMRLTRDYKNLTIKKLPKSGGVIQNEETQIQLDLENYIHHYFIGEKNEIKSSKVLIPFEDIDIYQLTKNMAMKTALPADFKTEDIELLRVIRIDPLEKNLTKRILGLSHYKKVGDDPKVILAELVKNPIAFIGYVESVDYAEKKLEILLPTSEIPEYLIHNVWIFSEIALML